MNQLKINIKARDLELIPELRTHIEDKIAGVQKVMSESKSHEILTDVEVSKKTHHKKGDVFRAEINMSLEGKLFRAKSTEFDIKVAVDDAVQELTRQVRKSKEKRIDLFRQGGKKIKRLLKFGKE